MDNFKKFDIHVHTDLWGGTEIPRFDGNPFATPDELRVMYEKLGIDKAVLLPVCSIENAFALQSNEQAAIVAAQNPDLFVWFMNIDPRMAYNRPNTNLTYFMEHYMKMGAKGLGELVANIPADDPLLDNLFGHAAECGLPVTIHLAPDDQQYGYYGIQDSLGLPRLEAMLKKHPKLKILAHSQMFWSHMSGDNTRATMCGYPTGKVVEGGAAVRLLREYEGLMGDMSAGSGGNAFMRDPDFGCALIEELQDKLYFGTDICCVKNDMRLSYWLDDMLAQGRISEKAYRKVSRENALKLLGLDK